MLEKGSIIGLIGLEPYDRYGLLRSLVVHPDHRNKRIAETLVTKLEKSAKASGIITLYLLTETADRYFGKKGYQTVARDEVPEALKQSS